MTDKAVALRPGAEPLTDADRAAGRTAARIDVAAAVWTLWDRVRKDRGLDQQWLADRMGKSKSRVSRLLKGPGNWTLDTVGDLLEAMEASFTCVEAHTYEEIAEGKAWKAALKERPTTRISLRLEIVAELEVPLLDDEVEEVTHLPRSSLPLRGTEELEHAW